MKYPFHSSQSSSNCYTPLLEGNINTVGALPFDLYQALAQHLFSKEGPLAGPHQTPESNSIGFK